jgi:hypothetical protein
MGLNLKEMRTQTCIRKQTVKFFDRMFLSEKLFNNVDHFLKNIFRCKWVENADINYGIN